MILVLPEDASDLLEAGLAFEEDVLEPRDAEVPTVDVLLRTENMPEFVAAFRAWCVVPWATWAEAERPRRRSIDVYNRLFAHQRMVAAGDDTPIECVMGVGVARWQHPHGRLDAPLVEQMVELQLDEADGSVVVRPRPQPRPTPRPEAQGGQRERPSTSLSSRD